MKKLFTLAIALLVAFAGYSQVRQTISKDFKAASMKKAARMEASFENVQSQPNMTRTEGELDYTTYDWQSNAAARTWTINWPDGKVSFAYTIATDESFSDRGTGIGTYDPVADEWIHCDSRVEPVKTGFGTIARYGENGIVVAAHTATQCGIWLVEDKDNITPECATFVSWFDPTYDPCWPNVMTSGPNHDIIHVVVTAYAADGQALSVPGAEGVNNPLIYFRSKDGGVTWDKQNVILPYMGTESGLDWGSNVAYWMQTTEDNCLALIVSNAWSDCFALVSYDDGDTWEKKTFWHHPGITTTYDSWFMYPRWTSAQWGVDGELCVAFEFNGSTGEPGSGSYYPALGGVGFWSENLPYAGDGHVYDTWGSDPTNPVPPVPGQPFIMDSAYIFNDIYAAWPRWSDQTYDNPYYFGYVYPMGEDGEVESWEEAQEMLIEDYSLHGAYNSGCSAMPALAKMSEFDLVTVWSAMDESVTDGNGNFYYKLFASYSGDGGRTWSTPKHLTNNFMWQYSECVYVQASVVGNTLVVAAMLDGTTGTFVQSDDDDSADNLYQGLTFDLNELFPDAGVNVPENNTVKMNIYPNPAVDQLNVNLSQGADIVIFNVMGQAVRTVEGHVGANTVDLSGLTSGVYFVNAGSNTQKFIVK